MNIFSQELQPKYSINFKKLTKILHFHSHNKNLSQSCEEFVSPEVLDFRAASYLKKPCAWIKKSVNANGNHANPLVLIFWPPNMAAVQLDWSSIVPSREDTRGCTRYTRRARVTLRDRAQSDSLQALTFTLPAVESVFIVIAVAWKRGCMHMHTYVSTRLNTKFAGFKVEPVVFQGFRFSRSRGIKRR